MSAFEQSEFLTADIIQENLDMNWDFNWMSCKPYVTWDLIENNIDKEWNWFFISLNDFTNQKEIILEKIIMNL